MVSSVSVALVFVVPIIVSCTIAGAVMAQILQEPWRGDGESSEYVSVVGLESAYTAPASVTAFVHVTHDSFDCGNLYVEVREQSTQQIISQNGFFEQCFRATNTMIPLNGGFVTEISQPGTYELVVSVSDVQQKSTTSVIEVFRVN